MPVVICETLASSLAVPLKSIRAVRQRVGPVKTDLCARQVKRESGQAHDAIVQNKVPGQGAFNPGGHGPSAWPNDSDLPSFLERPGW